MILCYDDPNKEYGKGQTKVLIDVKHPHNKTTKATCDDAIPKDVYLTDGSGTPLYYVSDRKVGSVNWGYELTVIPTMQTETNCTTEQATEIMPEVLEQNHDNRDSLFPVASAKGPFNSVEREEVNKTFYIPKSVYTNIQTGKYDKQKNLQLKTIDAVENINNYYKVRLVAEIPNDKVVQDPNELYQILINCGVNTKTAEVAVQTAMEN